MAKPNKASTVAEIAEQFRGSSAAAEIYQFFADVTPCCFSAGTNFWPMLPHDGRCCFPMPAVKYCHHRDLVCQYPPHYQYDHDRC